MLIINKPKKNAQIVICSVPGSAALKPEPHGITMIASKLAQETGNIDGTKILIRKENKEPAKASHGNSAKEASIGLDIDNTFGEVKDKAVLLLDDVCKSGSSMLAARCCLLNNHAARVVCLAIGYTYNSQYIHKYTSSLLVEAIPNYLKKMDKLHSSVIEESHAFLLEEFKKDKKDKSANYFIHDQTSSLTSSATTPSGESELQQQHTTKPLLTSDSLQSRPVLAVRAFVGGLRRSKSPSMVQVFNMKKPEGEFTPTPKRQKYVR